MNNLMNKIFEFIILHEGWEMDNKGWIEKQSNGILKLMTTGHGFKYEMSIEELSDKITETEKSLEGLKKAMDLITQQ